MATGTGANDEKLAFFFLERLGIAAPDVGNGLAPKRLVEED